MPALPLTLSLLIAASAAGTIAAEHRQARRAVYLFKPLTTILILALAATAPEPVARGYQALVCAGLLFSLAGDVFLMLPRDRFVAGLASFLVAHLFYTAAVAPRPPALAAPLVLALLAAYGMVMMRALWPRLGTLRAPVAVYAAALLVAGKQPSARSVVLNRSRASDSRFLIPFLVSVGARDRSGGRVRAAPPSK